ncbi:MAG: PQQ-binding-like beta-propeller repeat protein, partial [Deltaproteobacteria bacterium]
MIRIHPGRAWRLDAQLLSELRSPRGPRALERALVDAVGIEVDGVDLAAGLAEGSVLSIMSELSRVVASLGAGARRGSVAFRGEGVVLLLERECERVRLTLVRLSRPAGVVLRGVEVELDALRRATLDCGLALLRELRSINPALAQGPSVRRLSLAVSRLGARAQESSLEPELDQRGRPRRKEKLALRGGSGPGFPACRFELSDGAGLLHSYAGGRDLGSLLLPGDVVLALASRAPAVRRRGHPFLALRELSDGAVSLVRAIRAGERSHLL